MLENDKSWKPGWGVLIAIENERCEMMVCEGRGAVGACSGRELQIVNFPVSQSV